MTARVPCCVPFCRRTSARIEFSEWICGDHWHLVPKRYRQAYGRLVKQWRRYHRDEDGYAACRIWRRIKSKAIEAAGGIG